MSSLTYCIKMAQNLPYKRRQSRHYCVIVDKRGKIVSQAANDYTKTHPLMHKTSRKLGYEKDYCHSEMLALVRSRGKGVKMYVARVGSDNNPCYSAPCPTCARLIAESQIKSVEFTV